MTANGTDISDGESLSGSQIVRVYGSNLTPPYFSLWFNGVEYTPLDYGDGYVEYQLQNNGTATIYTDDSPFMSFEVEGVIVPEVLPMLMKLQQTSSDNQHINVRQQNVNCLNYNYAFNSDYPFFSYQWYRTNVLAGIDRNDFGYYNCSAVLYNQNKDQILQRLELDNEDEVAYITYQGFIVAVFNYTTTP